MNAQELNRKINEAIRKDATSLEILDVKLAEIPDSIGDIVNLSTLTIRRSSTDTTQDGLPPTLRKLRKLIRLDLSGNRFVSLPSEIWELKNLSELNISGNCLDQLSPNIAKFSNLTFLDVSGNQLTTLPDEIGQLSNLRHLELGGFNAGNRLTQLSPQVGRLDMLNILSLGGNRLKKVPEELWQLTNLTHLDLGGNQISEISPEISRLRSLETLDLSGNELRSLPAEFGQLVNLKKLILGGFYAGNMLRDLPEELGNLSKLEYLVLGGNQFVEFPPDVLRLSSLRYLDFGGNQLATLPWEIGQLNNLTDLNLADNLLYSLPDSIDRLLRLNRLNLSRNRLHDWPEKLQFLPNLNELYIRGNPISSLSETIGQLKKLTILDICFCEITSLPPTISQLSNLRKLALAGNLLHDFPRDILMLSNLEELDAQENKFSYIPEDLHRLKKLKTLNVASNQLNSIPHDFQVTALQVLDLSHNNIATLPENSYLFKLPNLECIYLSDNQLTELPRQITELPSLKELYVAQNQLQRLPKYITSMETLQELSLDNNPLKVPPPEIAIRGLKAIQNYYHQLTNENYCLYEAKLLMVGEARVGKTALTKSLSVPNYTLKDEQSTQGIDINTWIIPKAELELEKEFRLNIWDFGGQEIYHATHQFFMTKRSLYILVTESRQEDKHDDFFYWFNIIRTLGDNSPVILVLNKIDQPTKELPIKRFQRDFKNIVSFVKTSCCENFRDTIECLKSEIVRIIKDPELMPLRGIPVPKAWVIIREELESLRLEGKDYISYFQYLAICEKCGIDERRALYLSDFFHVLGVFLHFREDLDLHDTIFLNHEWVTDGVYKVLDSKKVKQQQGRFYDEDLAYIWSESDYYGKRRELLALMKNRKFELCYELREGGYLVPQLLPVDEPDFNWSNKDEVVIFEYRYVFTSMPKLPRYDFMPKGILTRFIVKCHNDIYEHTVWRYGVLLKYDNTKALVREDYFRRKITIELKGNNKRGFLDIIRKKFNEIHSDYNKLLVEELIPCNCSKCKYSDTSHLYPYENLRRRLENHRMEIECEISYELVNIYSLIDDVLVTELSAHPKFSYTIQLLRESLSRLYGTVAKARRLADDSGLDITRINFSTSAVEFWHSLLSEAHKQDKVMDIVSLASSEYRAQAENLWQAYQTYVDSQQ